MDFNSYLNADYPDYRTKEAGNAGMEAGNAKLQSEEKKTCRSAKSYINLNF
ncbi:MAG: hypothetical protein K9G38_08020 [Bacteroidales bacterium]|nr:hypothetical protein [Bacteroidales bacterium]